MQYIIFDLEFNSTRNKRTGKFVNEIIEIGAVKLDERFNPIDSFSQMIKPVLSKKLNKYVRELTGIREEELQTGESFEQTLARFKRWVDGEAVFLTWSNTDLHVLLDNYKTFLGKSKIGFIKKYADLQNYVLKFISTENNNQIALTAAAEHFGIDASDVCMHRALCDSTVCARLLKATYDEGLFLNNIIDIEKDNYYNRIGFKPYYISDINDDNVNKREFQILCPDCHTQAKRVSDIKFRFKAFTCYYKCPECKSSLMLSVRFKKTFDKVVVSKTIKRLAKTRALEKAE